MFALVIASRFLRSTRSAHRSDLETQARSVGIQNGAMLETVDLEEALGRAAHESA